MFSGFCGVRFFGFHNSSPLFKDYYAAKEMSR
jgi:hypothetical protein